MISNPNPLRVKSERFRFAREWLENSKLLEILAPDPVPGGRGRPAKYPRYPIRGLILTLMEIALDGRTLTFTEVRETLFRIYDEDDLHQVGLGDLSKHSNYHLFRYSDPLTWTPVQTRLWNNEYGRIWDAFKTSTAPINDNAFENQTPVSNSALREAQAKNSGGVETAARNEALNTLVQGSVYTLNHDSYPHLDPRDLHNGILKDHRQDYTIDETPYVWAKQAGHVSGADNAIAPKPELGGSLNHGQDPYATKIGITILCTAFRPDSVKVPNLAVACGIEKPKAASATAAKVALESIIDAGIRIETGSNARQWVVTDKAYPFANDYNATLARLQFDPVREYREDDPRVVRLETVESALDRASGRRTDTGHATAAHLVNGSVICPAVRRRVLEELTLDAPKPIRQTDGSYRYDDVELDKHARDGEFLDAFTMRTHERLTESPLRKGGRPKKGAPTPPNVFKQKVECPAHSGKVRCPLVEASMQDTSLPIAPNPPIDNPPSTCRSVHTTIVFSDAQVKLLQPERSGTWKHLAMYQANRAFNELFNERLKDRQGGNLTPRRIEATLNATMTLFIGLTVGATNYHVMNAWRKTLNHNDGRPPRHHFDVTDRARRNQLEAYRATRAA